MWNLKKILRITFKLLCKKIPLVPIRMNFVRHITWGIYKILYYSRKSKGATSFVILISKILGIKSRQFYNAHKKRACWSVFFSSELNRSLISALIKWRIEGCTAPAVFSGAGYCPTAAWAWHAELWRQ